MAEKNMPALPPAYRGSLSASQAGYYVPQVYSADQMHAYAKQYAEQRVREEREACARACEAEMLTESQKTEGDIAYDMAVAHCAAAIRQRSNP